MCIRDRYRLQDYQQTNELDYFSEAFGPGFYKVTFQYIPSRANANAALSFHLTASEKKDIEAALNESSNLKSFQQIINLMK